MVFSNRWGLAMVLVLMNTTAPGCDFIFGRKLNPRYCKAHLSDPDCQRAFPDATLDEPMTCTGDEQCTAPLVCDLGATMMCVQCTMNEHDACMGTTPICVDRTCQKCTEHTQCVASSVCLPDGSCADEAQVAYVQAGGSGSACTKVAPCGTLDVGVQTNKPIVKVAAGTIADDKTTIIDGKAVMILADPGAKLTRTNQGVILEVLNAGTDVQIFDLEITGGIGATDAAIVMAQGTPSLMLARVTIDLNLGVGVLALAGTLTISRSMIRGNMGGGISISGSQFDITNSYIVHNGSSVSTFGGLDISQILVDGTHRLDFNTISANNSNLAITTNGGVKCSTITVPLAFDSNIIFGNNVSSSGTQIGGDAMCTANYSDVGPDTLSGMGNINADPMFVNPTQNDFHLMSTSPAKDAANPAATLAVDADGDARPQGQQHDMGADEIKP